VNRYKYYFFELDEPISIEARNKYSARQLLEEIVNQKEYKERGYDMLGLRKETSETLVEGVSTKNTRQHGLLVWTDKGWAKNK
jgi:predicted kinase